MPSIFISHASPDRPFALRLASSLKHLGHSVWIDTKEIRVGASIPQAVGEAAERAEYLILVVSRHSVASSWCEHEWQAKYWTEVASRQILVLPVLLEECPIPFFLRPKRYADFRSDYALGLAQLALTLDQASSTVLGHVRHDRHDRNSDEGERIEVAQSTLSSPVPVWYDDSMNHPSRLVEVHVDLQLPYLGKIAGVWKPDEREQDAAWEMYVELATRIAVAELPPNEGLLREGLSSLYDIFTTTRQILRSYGPAVARPKAESEVSFGFLAISILNYVLRPVLAKWHPLLLDYEHQRTASISTLQHEAAWERAEELRCALTQVRSVLLAYADLLAQISRVPMMIPS